MTFLQRLPNILTVSRIMLAGIFLFLLLFMPFEGAHFIALLVFFVASLTDYFDGKIARWQKSTSVIGAFLDPLADKVLIVGAFLAFIELRLIPAWMVVVILAREFLITGLRLVASGFGKSIPASKIAKHKTVSQMVVIYLVLLFLCFKDYAVLQNHVSQIQVLIFVFMYITIFITIVSGAMYFYANRYVFKRKRNR
ncbi:MAG: CDP-diacylglycerol--glycerol-3-phosphate 3-phosphatidyltransferase [Candidatus Saelkia tenebricola]|nr:CDP-diacylglycerol--glycerol-3-phosphate 3-phosphatidyltransferase [Candidatus Saelkia tenebricola]